MRKVFADTLYWVALVHPADSWHELAIRARDSLGDCVLVTTDEVLDEFLTSFARGGPALRERAVATVHAILTKP